MPVLFFDAHENDSSHLLNLIGADKTPNSYVISNVSSDYANEIKQSVQSKYKIFQLEELAEINDNEVWLIKEGHEYSFDGKQLTTNNYDLLTSSIGV